MAYGYFRKRVSIDSLNLEVLSTPSNGINELTHPNDMNVEILEHLWALAAHFSHLSTQCCTVRYKPRNVYCPAIYLIPTPHLNYSGRVILLHLHINQRILIIPPSPLASLIICFRNATCLDWGPACVGDCSVYNLFVFAI